MARPPAGRGYRCHWACQPPPAPAVPVVPPGAPPPRPPELLGPAPPVLRTTAVLTACSSAGAASARCVTAGADCTTHCRAYRRYWQPCRRIRSSSYPPYPPPSYPPCPPCLCCHRSRVALPSLPEHAGNRRKPTKTPSNRVRLGRHCHCGPPNTHSGATDESPQIANYESQRCAFMTRDISGRSLREGNREGRCTGTIGGLRRGLGHCFFLQVVDGPGRP